MAQYVRQNISVSSISTVGVGLLGSLFWPRQSRHLLFLLSLLQPLLVGLRLLGAGRPGDCRSRGSEVSCYCGSGCSCSCSSSCSCSCSSSCSGSCSCSCSCSYSFFCSSYYSSFFSYCYMPARGDGTGPPDWVMPGLLPRPHTVLQHADELGVVGVDVVGAQHSVYSDSVIYWLLSPRSGRRGVESWSAGLLSAPWRGNAPSSWSRSPGQSLQWQALHSALGREDVEESRGVQDSWLPGDVMFPPPGVVVQWLWRSVRSRWTGGWRRRGEAVPLAWLSLDPRSAPVLVGDWLRWGELLPVLCRTAVSTVWRHSCPQGCGRGMNRLIGVNKIFIPVW